MPYSRNALSRAYQKALARLRTNHDAEFHAILAQVYVEEGMDVRKRASRGEMMRRRLEDAKRLVEESASE